MSWHDDGHEWDSNLPNWAYWKLFGEEIAHQLEEFRNPNISGQLYLSIYPIDLKYFRALYYGDTEVKIGRQKGYDFISKGRMSLIFPEYSRIKNDVEKEERSIEHVTKEDMKKGAVLEIGSHYFKEDDCEKNPQMCAEFRAFVDAGTEKLLSALKQ